MTGSAAAASRQGRGTTTTDRLTPHRPLLERSFTTPASIWSSTVSHATEQAILRLIKANNGFVAESDHSSLTSTQRQAMWRVRVPVDQFDAFVESVSRLGEVKQQHIGSQDVTAEFVDIEARIRNKQEEEKRLLKHLSDSTGKLEDILAVEREIAPGSRRN